MAQGKHTPLLSIEDQFKQLEKQFGGKIGVYAINTNNGQIIAYRDQERFPVQSTLKLMGVAALLKASDADQSLLQEKIHYTPADLTPWHPITGKYLGTGMTLEALSEAAITYSDNPAMNLIMKKLGGPAAITNFAHSIGNSSFCIEHEEGSLNSNPNSMQDTATPRDMAMSVRQLMLGTILSSAQKEQLTTWMKNNTTGYKRMRAGVPLGWAVADKTGSGEYGVANDIGILLPPACKPVVLAIYTARNKPNAERKEEVIASATHLVLDDLAQNDACLRG